MEPTGWFAASWDLRAGDAAAHCLHGGERLGDSSPEIVVAHLGSDPLPGLLGQWLGSGCHGDPGVTFPFAAVVWDPVSRGVVVVAGPRWELPVAWSRSEDRLVVATRLPDLLDHLPNPTAEPTAAVRSMLRWGGHDAGETAWRQVRRVRPGDLVRFAAGAVPRHERWHDEHRWTTSVSPATEGRAMREAVARSVRPWAQSGSAAAVAMSGGLDSTTVAALSVRGGATTVGYCHVPARCDDDRDRFDATMAPLMRAVGVEVHLQPTAARPAALDLLPGAFVATAAPVPNPAALAWWRQIAAAARADGLDRLLVGQSGNVTFSGPARRRRRVPWRSRMRRLAARSARRGWTPGPVDPAARLVAAGMRPEALSAAVGAGAFSPLSTPALIRAGSATTPPEVFAIPAYTAGMPVVDPFADPQVVGMALSLPEQAWGRHGLSRSVARRAAAGLLPDPVRWAETRGRQSGDQWVARLSRRADYRHAVAELAGTAAEDVVDLEVLGASIADWTSAPALARQWDFSAGRVLALGMFLAWAQQRRSSGCAASVQGLGMVIGPEVA